MKALFLTVLLTLCAFSTSAFAEDISNTDLTDFNDLTAVQQAAVVTQIAASVEQNAAGIGSLAGDTSVEDIDQWVDLGEKVGKMLGGTAKELGIAANEFAKSPLGVMAMVLIIWNYAGADLYGFIVGIFWFSALLPLWAYLFFKIGYPIKSYVDCKKVRWGKERVVSKPVREFSGTGDGFGAPAVVFAIIGFLILFAGMIIIV